MNTLGYVCLILIAPVCLAGLGLGLAARSSRRRNLMRAAAGAAYAVVGLAVLASIMLLVALLTRDFSNNYVYEYTSRALSTAYTLSAFWAGNAGSLLLWLLLMAIFSLIAIRQLRREDAPSAPYATAILMAITTFFSLLMLFGHASNPFVGVPGGATPADGLGLNPMLRNPGMVIHPVALYLGYVAFAVPFAVAMGGLISRSPSASWLPALRRWVLIGWFFLTIGNLVGAWWAYVTLGWGGYWGWDPVENASLMPWLTGTALVHAVIMVRKRQMFSAWMGILVAVTFLLTIFGTFLTRSGIATSVHAFSDNTFIPWFTVFLLIGAVFSAAVLITRWNDLKSTKRLQSAFSRESAFLYTNLILVVITFVVLWGVMFPTIAGAIQGTKVELDPSFFTVATVPLGLILLLLTGLGPMLPWTGADRSRLVKDMAWTGGGALVVLVALLLLGVRHVYPLLSFALAFFAAATIAIHYGRGWRNRRRASGARGVGWLTSFGGMFWNNRSRYGGFLVHLGVILVLVGITGSYAFKQEVSGSLAKGTSMNVGRFVVTYNDLVLGQAADKQTARAYLTVSHNGQLVAKLAPVKEYYPASDQTWTRVDRYSTLAGDVYVSLLGYTGTGDTVTLQVDLNPLVNWLWIGGGVMVVGGVVVMWPMRRRLRAKSKGAAVNTSQGKDRAGWAVPRTGAVSKAARARTGEDE